MLISNCKVLYRGNLRFDNILKGKIHNIGRIINLLFQGARPTILHTKPYHIGGTGAWDGSPSTGQLAKYW